MLQTEPDLISKAQEAIWIDWCDPLSRNTLMAIANGAQSSGASTVSQDDKLTAEHRLHHLGTTCRVTYQLKLMAKQCVSWTSHLATRRNARGGLIAVSRLGYRLTTFTGVDG